MARPLERPQHHELEQAPDVQARRRRVEAAVVGHRPLGESRPQRRLVGALGDQPAAVQLVDHVFRHRAPSCPAPATAGLPARPEHAHRRRIGLPEPPRQVGREADPHPWAAWRSRPAPGRGAAAPASAGVEQVACRDPRGRWPAPGSAGRGHRASSRCRPGGRTARPRQLLPHHDLAGAQQHRLAVALRPHHDVRAPVHAVGEVDVEPHRAGRT